MEFTCIYTLLNLMLYNYHLCKYETQLASRRTGRVEVRCLGYRKGEAWSCCSGPGGLIMAAVALESPAHVCWVYHARFDA